LAGDAMILLLTGWLTWYAATGNPLRCTNVPWSTDDKWIAVDIDAYGWRCGDLVRVTVGDDEMLLPVLDSGPLSAYNIRGVEIVADLPAHLWRWPGLSVMGTVVNVTGGLREQLCLEK